MIEILLATHNGGRYLPEQLDSLLAQTCQDFQILVQDDNSSDNTLAVLREYQERYPEKIRLLQPITFPGGAASNFLSLALQARGEYIMFCDQDDVWLRDKVALTLHSMRELEAVGGSGCPSLVFSSYRPVDQTLSDIGMHTSRTVQLELCRLLVSNCVSGCSMMCNRALYTLFGTYSEEIMMHDWWAALIAAAMGKIFYLPQELMLYRQHDDNAVGYARVKSPGYWLRRIKRENLFQRKQEYYRQAALLRNRLGDQLEPSARETLDSFLEISGYKNKLHRMSAICRGRFVKDNPFLQLAFLLTI